LAKRPTTKPGRRSKAEMERERKMLEDAKRKALAEAMNKGTSQDDIEIVKDTARIDNAPRGVGSNECVDMSNIKLGGINREATVQHVDFLEGGGGEVKGAESVRSLEKEMGRENAKKLSPEALRKRKRKEGVKNQEHELNVVELAKRRKKLADGGDNSSDDDEKFTLTRKELFDLLANPLGALVAGNEKDADFVTAYMRCGNVVEALRECEYASRKVLRDQRSVLTLAHEIMRRPEIQAAIAWCRKRQLDDLIVSRDEWADYLSQIVRANVGDLIDDDGMLQASKIRQYGRAIQSYSSTIAKNGSVRITIKMKDPLAAAKELRAISKMRDTDDGPSELSSPLNDKTLDDINDDSIDVKVVEEGEVVEE